jgi:hypothetical protein
LVTTGGGALPLPVFAQAARLRIARTIAVPNAIFFMVAPILMVGKNRIKTTLGVH